MIQYLLNLVRKKDLWKKMIKDECAPSIEAPTYLLQIEYGAVKKMLRDTIKSLCSSFETEMNWRSLD